MAGFLNSIGYNLAKDRKDPVIDVMRTMYQDAQQLHGKITKNAIEAAGGPKSGTIKAWFEGETLCPQGKTIASFVRALGGDVLYALPGANGHGNIYSISSHGTRHSTRTHYVDTRVLKKLTSRS